MYVFGSNLLRFLKKFGDKSQKHIKKQNLYILVIW